MATGPAFNIYCYGGSGNENSFLYTNTIPTVIGRKTVKVYRVDAAPRNERRYTTSAQNALLMVTLFPWCPVVPLVSDPSAHHRDLPR